MASDEGSGMVVLASRPGQLGNRLLLHAHLLGFALSHGVRIADPAFGDYAEHFPHLRADALCRFPPSGRPAGSGSGRRHRGVLYWLVVKVAAVLHAIRPRTSLWNIVRTDWTEPFDLDDAVFAEGAARRRLTVLQGWLFRAEESVQRHAPAIRDLLRPDPGIAEAAQRRVAQMRVSAGRVVGVHVRRGDYRTLHDGAYFYDMEQYAALIEQAADLFGDSVSFLACSDSPQDLRTLRATEHVEFGVGDALVDLFSLAACDYLIGPPSTYTMWASFYGETPLYIVHDPAAPFSADAFAVFDLRGYPSSVHAHGPTYW